MTSHPLPWTYPVIMILSIATGALLLRRSRIPTGLGRWEERTLALGAFCGAMIGAKVTILLVDPRTSWRWADLLDGGKTILGGLLGGYFGVELAKWALELKVKTGDTFAVPVAASVAVGRLACFVGGCCYGRPTSLPWGMDFGDGILRHPTQLYEAAFHAVMAVVLSRLRQQGQFQRQLMKLYVVSYLAFRFATEFIRPEPRLWENLTGYQLLAVPMIALFAVLWMRDAEMMKIDA